MFDIFTYPFMQRAFIAGILLGLILSWLGIFVILRRISFFGEGIAHASLAGIAIGLLFSTNPLLTAILYCIIFSVLVYYLERKTNLSADAIIGILFTASMAFGIVLIHRIPGYQPDLSNLLFGNILAIHSSEVVIMAIISAIIFIFLLSSYRKLTFIILDPDGAYLSGMNAHFYNVLFYITLAVAIVLGVKMLGIILISSLLILPASIAKLMSHSYRSLTLHTIIVSEFIIVLGILLSYSLNVATGPMIVLTGTAIFLLTLLFKSVKIIQ